MQWAFWRRKPKVRYPRILFEMHEDGIIKVTTDWPEPETIEVKVNLAESIASMAWFISDGQLLNLIQQSIAISGHLKKDEPFSQHVFHCLNYIISKSGYGVSNGNGTNGSGPLVSPDEVFDHRGGRNEVDN